MNVTEAWEMMLVTVADSMTHRMKRARKLNDTIKLFREATDTGSIEDVEKMQVVLADNLDHMRNLVEAAGMFARGLDGFEDKVDTSSTCATACLAIILEMHPDGSKEYP